MVMRACMFRRLVPTQREAFLASSASSHKSNNRGLATTLPEMIDSEGHRQFNLKHPWGHSINNLKVGNTRATTERSLSRSNECILFTYMQHAREMLMIDDKQAKQESKDNKVKHMHIAARVPQRVVRTTKRSIAPP